VVKLIAGSSDLEKLFKSVLPLKRQIECPIKFTPTNAQINFVFPSGEIGILAKFSFPYFIAYESSEEEFFVVHRKLIDNLKLSFKNDTEITFWTDSQHVHIVGEQTHTRYISSLIPVKEKLKAPSFQPYSHETGLLPTYGGKELELNVHARFCVEDLIKNLPKGEKNAKIGLSWDGKTLELSHIGSSIVTRPLNPEAFSSPGEPIAVYFDSNDFQSLAKKFVGEVWLGIASNGVVISQAVVSRAKAKRSDNPALEANYTYALTYLLTAESVD
jgi:hypothetical protein